MLREKDYDYEIVGVFSSIEELDQAVDELFTHGYNPASLSVLANEEAIKHELKRSYRRINELMDDSNVPRATFYAEENFILAQGVVIGVLMYIGGIIAAYISNIKDGSIFLALITAGISTLVGVLLASIIKRHHSEYIEQQLQKGGLILWVQLHDKASRNIVARVLKNNNATHVHLRYMPKKIYSSSV